jgi:hypothetical protein
MWETILSMLLDFAPRAGGLLGGRENNSSANIVDLTKRERDPSPTRRGGSSKPKVYV